MKLSRKQRLVQKRTQQRKVFKQVRYRTQCLKVGAVKCLFLSCWDMGRSPLLTLGPSWPFTICLLFFAFMILTYFLLMLSMAKDAEGWQMNVSYVGLTLNLLVLFGGILKNPGIPQPIIDKILKD